MKCGNCHEHEGTEKWVGEGSVMDFIHGGYEMWCKCCCLKYQVNYVKAQTSRLEGLEKELREIKCE